jgi:SAM-dependent methyltransferase
MTKTSPTIPRPQWESNLKAEAAYWANWLTEGVAKTNKQIEDDFFFRTRPDADVRLKEIFAPYLRPPCPPGSKARILDVGAGPLTAFPREWKTRDFKVTPIDPLADEFDKMLAAKNIIPQFRTIKGEAESLDAQFPADSFHLVFCRNALEQFHDPLAGIRQMLKVVMPDCWVIFLQEDYRT